ncbi:MAG: hypothetical protein DWH81_04645 [Planctomycetota bacterium]|jgi:hypothetical protein|nr:MAG: hypothetical protein DWH81_04645 [Planctomycetota bacterium]
MPLRHTRIGRSSQRGCFLERLFSGEGSTRRGKKQESRSLTRVNSIGDSPPGLSLIPESELLSGALVRKTLRGKGFVSINRSLVWQFRVSELIRSSTNAPKPQGHCATERSLGDEVTFIFTGLDEVVFRRFQECQWLVVRVG